MEICIKYLHKAQENIIMKVMYMKKFFVVLSILLIILVIAIYAVYVYRSNTISARKQNREYEAYQDVEVLGTELISIINKTIDINIKNGVARDENQYFIDNENDSIQIYIKFIYKDETKTIQMEDIERSGIEAFVKIYSTASFKCTDIQYHAKTKKVKSLTFEEIVETSINNNK